MAIIWLMSKKNLLNKEKGKKMILNSQLKKIMLLGFICTPLSKSLTVQPGENIWHLAASIATQIDTLSQCNLTPLSGTSITISTSGTYCLSNNLMPIGNIIIAASDVYLDLNEQTISNVSTTTGIVVGNGQQRITIANGSLDNCLEGIVTGSGAQNITIKNIQISNVTTGIECDSTSSIFISDVHVSQFRNYGIGLLECANAELQDCIVQNSFQSNAGLGYGFYAQSNNTPIVNLNISHCSAVGDYGPSSNIGFYINIPNEDPSISVLKNCNSQNFALYGFDLFSDNQADPIFCQDCTASANLQAGFHIQCSSGLLQNCIAQQNSTGFLGLGTFNPIITGMNDCIFENCNAHDNTASGFDLSNVGAGNVVKNCLATKNNIGYSVPAGPNVLFYFNSAIFNTTNNFSMPLNGISAPVNTMTETREYGDNLRDATVS